MEFLVLTRSRSRSVFLTSQPPYSYNAPSKMWSTKNREKEKQLFVYHLSCKAMGPKINVKLLCLRYTILLYRFVCWCINGKIALKKMIMLQFITKNSINSQTQRGTRERKKKEIKRNSSAFRITDDWLLEYKQCGRMMYYGSSKLLSFVLKRRYQYHHCRYFCLHYIILAAMLYSTAGFVVMLHYILIDLHRRRAWI